ncbi:hypothetical protein BO70DRAFT_64409 [Aspergillus heteromorphus CBS 117.55]|uniref:Uncharacterized protein n=1 Tax=Aspergillus heteromorphus CBS 117.55 TaxID=1448321 RepID=A0A317VWG7_9EURO|nr:uncharacterized protein BO70DRAFT_64409 [Aspergillus heteromorphus CBS 117.55]PWY77357.1 hypothetical protein BO70DRAFT_64409 [Aspergillus heteromorphus CBS 117.55]
MACPRPATVQQKAGETAWLRHGSSMIDHNHGNTRTGRLIVKEENGPWGQSGALHPRILIVCLLFGAECSGRVDVQDWGDSLAVLDAGEAGEHPGKDRDGPSWPARDESAGRGRGRRETGLGRHGGRENRAGACSAGQAIIDGVGQTEATSATILLIVRSNNSETIPIICQSIYYLSIYARHNQSGHIFKTAAASSASGLGSRVCNTFPLTANTGAADFSPHHAKFPPHGLTDLSNSRPSPPSVSN